MRSILIIDDEKDVASVIAEAVEQGIEGVTCTTEVDFDKAIRLIAELRPDAIVLDLMEGSRSVNLPGQTTWKSVWDETFCPIVIYTGSEADLQPPVPSDHPFVKRIQKGSGTEARVVDELRGFGPVIGAVQSLRTEIDAVIHKVLRDTAGSGFIPPTDAKYLLHAGRRRIAASMDDPTITGQRLLFSWESYLIPAMGEYPLTGDLLLQRGGAWNEPGNYRLLLTPSCDTARGGKVKTVLVAKCHPTIVMIEKFKSAVRENDPVKLEAHVMRLVLSQGSWNGWLPLPAVPSVLPGMVAYLKDLEVIPLESIDCKDASKPGFQRIASIDSPFREQVAWSYLTTAARPGMPDRDLKPWAEELVKAVEAQAHV